MVWRLPRLSYHETRRRIPIPDTLRPQRYISTLSSRDENIASILAQEPPAAGPVDTILVTGTVRTVRKQKRRSFLEIGDGSTSRPLQAVLEPHQAEGYVHVEPVRRRHHG